MKRVILTIFLILAVSTSATVITFDDLPDTGPDGALVPSGYSGFNWDSFAYINAPLYLPGTGFDNGTISGNIVANAYADPATLIIASASAFDFQGAYLGAGWNNGLNITVEGYVGGSLLGTRTVVVDTTGSTWFDFDFIGVDTLVFNSFGGVNAGLGDYGEHFVMDNFTFVPEPASLLLLGLGGLLIRKRK